MEFEKQFDEKIETMLKRNVYALICDDCGGGGMLDNETCNKCEGTGLYEWRTTELGTEIKKLISQSIEEERKRIEEWVSKNKGRISRNERETVYVDDLLAEIKKG